MLDERAEVLLQILANPRKILMDPHTYLPQVVPRSYS